ncbi:MAG: DUF427 domain-containing protein [Cyanobacteria bacterium J083]|nr:MAG: DUF427 domain-containing protein [Cyanobacteria bacterium J083]
MFSRPKPIKPQPGQESVWDYPRPPKLETCTKRIQVVFNGVIIADSNDNYRILETSHPPVYYISPQAIKTEYLQSNPQQSFCEWKGVAHYYDVVVKEKKLEAVAWFYPSPTARFKAIANYVAFYAQPMDACLVDGEKVTPQPGGFYGGWITKNIVGPFKGEPGSWGW